MSFEDSQIDYLRRSKQGDKRMSTGCNGPRSYKRRVPLKICMTMLRHYAPSPIKRCAYTVCSVSVYQRCVDANASMLLSHSEIVCHVVALIIRSFIDRESPSSSLLQQNLLLISSENANILVQQYLSYLDHFVD